MNSKLPGAVLCCLLMLLVSACASYGIVQNSPDAASSSDSQSYSLKRWSNIEHSGEVLLVLAFSGGGSRAAAMSYGVLQELRDTPIVIEGEKERLLDEVDHISSVSGGSFTAAYYGLHGDKTFDNFEKDFLRFDVEKHLTRSLFVPTHWFTRKGRTERAIEYYNKILFHDATFADMMSQDLPMIVINASDLAYGVRFSFIQEYFDFLCSDLRSFPIARAVAASSAVPVVFNPVVVENYAGCEEFQWPANTEDLAKQSDEFRMMYAGMQSYNDKELRKYIHFVDGGITDNMGLRAMSDVMALSGGAATLISRLERKLPSHVVFISVNASTENRPEMGESTKQPSMLAAMNAMTDVQLHRYNAATVDLVESELAQWAAKMSTPEHEVLSYFIQVTFEDVPEPQLKLFLNKVPTSFNLTDEQVDALIKSARSLLRADPNFQKLLADLAENP